MRPFQALAMQRGHLFPWVPVTMALGIGGYFALPVEPGLPLYLGAAALMGIAVLAAVVLDETIAPLALLLALVMGGFLVAGARAHRVAAPVLDYRFHGAVEGRVVTVDRSQSDAPRLTLDHVWIEGIAPDRTPGKLRISLHGDLQAFAARPGLWVGVTAHLSPPSPPSEPGGFDFRRRAWFQQIGAVGYTRNPVVVLAEDSRARGMVWLHRLRMALSQRIRARIDGDAGAFAAAILTGDRSAMPRATLQTLRDSNLAHLLAISGLHMGLLTGFVFAAVRYGLALVPPVALRLSAKKIAAGIALVAAGIYLALSGGNVATQRAFVMIAVMLAAVMVDRRAITLRAVALAAVIILTLIPESLLQAGFQMSFAATTALVAAFGALRLLPEGKWTPPRWTRPVLALVLSSAVAGAATAPIGAAHFNQIAQFGLLANLLTVPLMGAVVIPAAVMSAALVPLGAEGIGLAVMEAAIRWILGVAAWVAGLDGAVWMVPTPAAWGLPVFALGMLWLILWRGHARWAGCVPALAALVLWGQVQRPDLLIAPSGRLAGIMTAEGRALNKPKGDGFAARIWLENDGDGADQIRAADRAGFSNGSGLSEVVVGGESFRLLSGRDWQSRLQAACGPGWLIVPYELETRPDGDCRLLDREFLDANGAVAVFVDQRGLRIVTAAERAGRRLWTQ